MASMHPTEEQYTEAMQRHGTADWSADDERTEKRWLADRTGGPVDADDVDDDGEE